jgi:DNA-binding protein Fis
LGGPTPVSKSSPEELDPGLRALIRQRLTPDASDLYVELHREIDRTFLTLVLEHTQGNQRQAARLLGIARQTLRLKLRELGLHVTHTAEVEGDE